MTFSRSAITCALCAALLSSPAARAQSSSSAPVATTPADAPKDAFGRDTPRGTLLGFMKAAHEENAAVASAYLNTTLLGQAAVELVHQLYVVLDNRLPARLGEVSDRPEGGAPSPLTPDVDIIGTVQTAGGSLDIVVERVRRPPSGRVWLFSRQTLEAIADAYDEIHLLRLDRYLPRLLTKFTIGGVRLFDWLLLIVFVPACYRLLGVAGTLIGPFVSVWRRRYGRAPAAQPASLPGFVRLLVLAVAIRWGLTVIDVPLIGRQFWSMTTTIFVIVAVCWTMLLVNAWAERRFRRQFASAGHGDIAAPLRLVRRVADVLVVAAGAILALRFFGVDPTAALAGLGIGGIAVALAAQKTLENVIGGLSIIFDKAVRVGDFLKMGDTIGEVDYIGLRSTRIRTLDRTILSVPNGQIANVNIETLSSRDKFWFHHFLGLRYATTTRQMREVVDEITRHLSTHAAVNAESVRVRFLRFGQFSLDIELFAYVTASGWERFLEIQEELLLDVMTIVERSGAAIAFASQTLYLNDASVSTARPEPPLPGGALRHEAIT